MGNKFNPEPGVIELEIGKSIATLKDAKNRVIELEYKLEAEIEVNKKLRINLNQAIRNGTVKMEVTYDKMIKKYLSVPRANGKHIELSTAQIAKAMLNGTKVTTPIKQTFHIILLSMGFKRDGLSKTWKVKPIASHPFGRWQID